MCMCMCMCACTCIVIRQLHTSTSVAILAQDICIRLAQESSRQSSFNGPSFPWTSTGCGITANGAHDELVKPEGMSDYKLPAVPE